MSSERMPIVTGAVTGAARADFTMMGTAITPAARTAPSQVKANVQPVSAYR